MSRHLDVQRQARRGRRGEVGPAICHVAGVAESMTDGGPSDASEREARDTLTSPRFPANLSPRQCFASRHSLATPRGHAGTGTLELEALELRALEQGGAGTRGAGTRGAGKRGAGTRGDGTRGAGTRGAGTRGAGTCLLYTSDAADE